MIKLVIFDLDGVLVEAKNIHFEALNKALGKKYAISMRIQAIGEALKNLDKRERELLLKVADKNYWSRIIKTRDFISHHYVDIDAETVFDICSNELEELESKIILLKNL